MKQLYRVKGGHTFVLLCFSLLTHQLSAQVTVKGTVSDTTHHPLEFATVVVKGDSGIIANALTGDNGRYELQVLPGQRYTLEVSHLGGGNFRTHFMAAHDTVMDFALRNASRSLKEIVVDGHRSFERRADRFVFSPAREMAAGAAGIDIMQHVPLILFDQRTNAFSIVGKAGTVVYINNRKTNIPAQMLVAYLQSLPAENIKNVEIITNPGSEYAANTNGGVININVKRLPDEGWQGTITGQSQQGPYNTSTLNGFVNYRKGKVGLQIMPNVATSYNYGTANIHLVYTDKTETHIQNRNYRRYQVTGGGVNLDYDISEHSILSYQGYLAGVWGKSNSQAATTYRTGAVDSLQHMYTNGNDRYLYNFGNLNFHHTFNESGDSYLDANVDYNNFYQRQVNRWVIDHAGNYSSHLPQRFFNLSERLEFGRKIFAGMQLLAGGQYSATTIKNDMQYYTGGEQNDQSEDYRYKEQYYAGFFTLARQLGQRVSLKAGLRLEGTDYSTDARLSGQQADSNYFNLFPNGVISYALNNDHQFSLSYSRKITRPDVETLFPGRTYTSANYFTQNNPFLQPSLAHNIELAYVLKSKYVLNATYQRISNNFAQFVLPVVEDGVSKLKQTYYNYGQQARFNIVINYHDFMVKNVWELYVTPSYTYLDYKGTTPEVPLRLKNSNFNLLIDNYLYISKRKQWTAFVTFGYNSPYTYIQERRLNERTSLDLLVKKVIKQFSLYAGVYDLFNGGSIVNYELYKNPSLSQNRTDLNLYNRSVYVKVRYAFGNNNLHQNRQRNSANEDIKSRVGR